MRLSIVQLRSLLSHFALVVVVGLCAKGVAFSQEAETPDASEAETTDAAATETPPAEGEQAPVNPQELLDKGQEALKTGDFPTALQAFDALARNGERGVDQQSFLQRLAGYTGRGQALASMKEYDAAIEEFKLALDLEENFIPALLARGQMYLDIGNPENYSVALADFQKVVKAQRGNPAAQFGLGKALTLTGNYQPAIGPLTRFIEAQPENAEAYRLRGTAYASTYKMKEALDDLNKSLQLNPDDYETYVTLGALDFRNEDYKGATDNFAKAIELYKPKDPEDELPFVQGHLSRASAFIEMGKKLAEPEEKRKAYLAATQEAEKVLAQVDSKNPYYASVRASALYSRGLGERMQGDLQKAVQTFSEAIELNPDLAEAYYRRGICYHYLNDDQLAITDFVESANINFNDPRAKLWEGFTHAKMGDFQEAIRAYGDALAASDRYTPAFLNRGLAYMALGEYEKALADFNDAVRLEPTNPDYYFNRGMAFEALRNNEKAAESFASAIEFNNNHAAAYRHLADTMQQLGRNDVAAQYRKRASELEPPKKAE
jgi:tetratricopeptide (TPR) repeat protein